MGGDKKATTMVLKVDLQCSKCYKKIKRILCQFPQIQDQVFNEKGNTVTIKVVCCSPDCIKKKIARKGGYTVKNIEIIKVSDDSDVPNEGIDPRPPSPPTPVMPKGDEKLNGRDSRPPPPPEPVMPKGDEKLNGRDPPPPPPPEPVMPINGGTKNDKVSQPPLPTEPVKPKNGTLDGRDPPPPSEPVKPKDGTVEGRGPAPPPPEEPQKPKPDVPAVIMPYVQGFPVSSGEYYHDCSEGYYQYDGYCGRPVYDSYIGGRSYRVDENDGACVIM